MTKLEMRDPEPVVCQTCRIMVGWAERNSPARLFVCIPCFDGVQILRSQDQGAIDDRKGAYTNDETTA